MQNISSRSILRNLVKQGKANPPTPAYETATWPVDEKGNPMHPTKGFRARSRRGARNNRSIKTPHFAATLFPAVDNNDTTAITTSDTNSGFEEVVKVYDASNISEVANNQVGILD